MSMMQLLAVRTSYPVKVPGPRSTASARRFIAWSCYARLLRLPTNRCDAGDAAAVAENGIRSETTAWISLSEETTVCAPFSTLGAKQDSAVPIARCSNNSSMP